MYYTDSRCDSLILSKVTSSHYFVDIIPPSSRFNNTADQCIKIGTGRRVLAGRVNGFSRDGLGRINFGGFGRDPSGRVQG
jgi:hypothetical protein